jgi:glyoxylate/hydroxypyruvate reductase A
MAIAILVGRDEAEREQYQWFIRDWKQSLLSMQSDLDIRVWPDIGNPYEINCALVWSHPLGALKQFPQLKLIASLAAGVDHVFVDHHLPAGVPVVRVTDPYMKNDIVQYVAACVLNYIKRMEHWAERQRMKTWSKQPPFNYADRTIGVMGVGYLGSKALHVLHHMGLKVIGWSNSEKNIEDIKHYAGASEFNPFLSLSDVLVCMLPLTSATRGILNKETFARMPEGAYLINVGRGDHLVEQDLLHALDEGKLSGAALDVFSQEPLPSDHPFWTHPGIRVTPHIASVTNPATAAPQVMENYRRMQAGMELMNQVDLLKGY